MKNDEQVEAIHHVANSITAPGAPGKDAAGGTVCSLTESVMGITAALVQIAEALYEVAAALDRGNDLREQEK